MTMVNIKTNIIIKLNIRDLVSDMISISTCNKWEIRLLLMTLL